MAVEDTLKTSFEKSVGMLGIVPPVIATGVVLRTVEKSFKPYSKKKLV